MSSVQDQAPTHYMLEQKVLEINADHPVIFDLLNKVKANADDPEIESTANLVAQAAVLQSNFDLKDPQLLVDSVYELVSLQYGLDPKAEVTPITPEVPPPKPSLEDLDDDDDDDDDDDEEEAGADKKKAEL